MNKKILNFCMIFIFIISFTISIYADRIDDLIKDVPGLEKYKNSSALNVYVEINRIVKQDYSYTEHVFHITKILNYKGKKENSDEKLPYNADYEKVELGNCFTIDPAGKRIPIPENQISDLNTRGSITNPLINYRETIINFPGIEPGYFIVLEYTLTNNRKKPVTGIEHFQGSDPYLYKKFTIKFPKKFNLNTNFDKNKLSFSESAEGESRIYTWEIKNSELIKRENNTPHYIVSGTPLVYSFYKDWNELARKKLLKVCDVPVDDSIKKLAKEVTAQCKTDEEKLLAVYKYLFKNFNYQYVIMSQLDFKPRPLTDVVKEKKGSIKDFVALFVSMLKSVGIKDIYPALTFFPVTRFAEVQKQLAVDYFIQGICVFWKNKLFAVGKSFTPFGFCVDEANVILGNKKFELIHFQKENKVIETHKYSYNIEGDSATVSVNSLFADHRNQQYRRRYMDQPQVRRKIWFNQGLGDKSAVLVDGPNFVNFDKVEEDLKLNFKLFYKDFLTGQAPYAYFKLFSPPLPLNVSLEKRDNDYQVFRKILCKEEFIINIDKKMTFINPIKEKKLKFKMGDRIAYFILNSRMKGEQIVLNREMYIPEAIIKKEDYKEFKKFIQEIGNPVNDMIFLHKVEPNKR